MKLSRFTPLLLLFPFLSTACTIIKFSASQYRKSPPAELKLNNNLLIRPTGAVYMNIAGIMKADFFSAGFYIQYNDKNIYIDPLVAGKGPMADYILITHIHADHYSLKDIESISGESTTIIAPRSVTKKIKTLETITIKPGDTLDLEDIRVYPVHAYNLKKGLLHSPLHKRNDNFTGYILNCGEKTLYHAGDTDLIPEMEKLGKVTVAMVPVGVGNTAMSPKRAAEAINLIQPQIAIPMHYDISEKPVPRFREDLNDGITVVEF